MSSMKIGSEGSTLHFFRAADTLVPWRRLRHSFITLKWHSAPSNEQSLVMYVDGIPGPTIARARREDTGAFDTDAILQRIEKEMEEVTQIEQAIEVEMAEEKSRVLEKRTRERHDELIEKVRKLLCSFGFTPVEEPQ
ncbi:hypothetical protein HKX48_009015 [Thoreauomyces humboldtii]|nr:hypothetical protein HKX48_009015 [Thoreauomyces humboldtii]